jgi:hypothetical protein
MFIAPLTAKRDEGRTTYAMEIHVKECGNGSSYEKEIEIRMLGATIPSMRETHTPPAKLAKLRLNTLGHIV